MDNQKYDIIHPDSTLMDKRLIKPINNINDLDIQSIPRLHKNQISSIFLDKNTHRLITGSMDKTVIVRDIKLNKKLKEFKGHQNLISMVTVLKDGRLVTCSFDFTIKIWNFYEANCKQTLQGHYDWVFCFVELANGFAISGSADNSLKLWNLNCNKKMIIKPYFHVINKKQAMCMIKSNINELIVSSDNDINIYRYNNLNYQDFRIIMRLRGHKNYVRDLKLLKSNDMLISSSNDKEIRLWRIIDGHCLRKYIGHHWAVNCLYQITDDIIVSGADEMKFWNIYNGLNVKTLKVNQLVNSIIHINENSIAVNASDSILIIKF